MYGGIDFYVEATGATVGSVYTAVAKDTGNVETNVTSTANSGTVFFKFTLTGTTDQQVSISIYLYHEDSIVVFVNRESPFETVAKLDQQRSNVSVDLIILRQFRYHSLNSRLSNNTESPASFDTFRLCSL